MQFSEVILDFYIVEQTLVSRLFCCPSMINFHFEEREKYEVIIGIAAVHFIQVHSSEKNPTQASVLKNFKTIIIPTYLRSSSLLKLLSLSFQLQLQLQFPLHPCLQLIECKKNEL